MEKRDVEELVHTYSKCVLRVAYTYVKNTNDAEDIAQEVFLSLLKCNQRFESKAHIKAWLIRVTMNKSKNYLKSSWISKRSEMPEEISAESQEENSVLAAVMELDAKYRIPVHLYYYEGYSIREIAEILHKRPATVGSCLDRARKKLKILLGGDYFGEK